jgi:uncharacterized protein
MAALPKLHIPALLDPQARTFATLNEADRQRASAVLRPLPWVDGLITAMVLSPSDFEPEGWSQQIWLEDELGKLTPAQAGEVDAIIIDHFDRLFAVLFENPGAYAPYLGNGDALEAATQWAAGFGVGIRLQPEPWQPLIDDEDARTCMMLIFCLERDEDQPEASRADSPFKDISPARRQEMRREAAAVLPDVVRALHALSLDVDTDTPFEVGDGPYVRTAPKVGRNDPCPCGSGKKHKTCCLTRLA